MEAFSMLLAIYAGNSPVPGEFPAQRPVTWNCDVFFDLRLNKRLKNDREAGDLRRYRAHYDVIVMYLSCPLILVSGTQVVQGFPRLRKSVIHIKELYYVQI